MALTNKETELVYLGASIAAGCKPCTSYHFRKVKETGASDEEISNAIADSISIKDNAKMEMEKHAMNLIGLTKQNLTSKDNLNPNRIKVLVSIGSAFAVNSAFTLQYYVDLRKTVCITTADLNKIFKAVKLIKMKAALYVDKIAIRFNEMKSEVKINNSGDCDCSVGASDVQNNPNKAEDNVEKGCC
jgi:AhpD family alkylhydroperoxidase